MNMGEVKKVLDAPRDDCDADFVAPLERGPSLNPPGRCRPAAPDTPKPSRRGRHLQ